MTYCGTGGFSYRRIRRCISADHWVRKEPLLHKRQTITAHRKRFPLRLRLQQQAKFGKQKHLRGLKPRLRARPSRPLAPKASPKLSQRVRVKERKRSRRGEV